MVMEGRQIHGIETLGYVRNGVWFSVRVLPLGMGETHPGPCVGLGGGCLDSLTLMESLQMLSSTPLLGSDGKDN